MYIKIYIYMYVFSFWISTFKRQDVHHFGRFGNFRGKHSHQPEKKFYSTLSSLEQIYIHFFMSMSLSPCEFFFATLDEYSYET